MHVLVVVLVGVLVAWRVRVLWRAYQAAVVERQLRIREELPALTTIREVRVTEMRPARAVGAVQGEGLLPFVVDEGFRELLCNEVPPLPVELDAFGMVRRGTWQGNNP